VRGHQALICRLDKHIRCPGSANRAV
jgi:hypothetical protein